jgi:predicted TIM-barrel fold metal-dependent hydrolase
MGAEPSTASGPMGALDTDVHFYVPNGISSVLEYVPQTWRRVFEVRGSKIGGDTSVPPRFDFPGGSRLRVDAFPTEGGPPGSSASFAQADLLDRFGLDGAILSSLEAGQQAQGFSGVDASPVLCSAFNDLALERWAATDRRFRLAMCVPSVHQEGAVAEIHRIGAHPGIAAVYLPLINMPLGNPYFHPIYQAAQEYSLPIFLHITAAEFTYQGLPAFPGGWLENFAERRIAYSVMGPAILANIVFSGILEKFPRLNFILAEFGFGWAVPLMWRMDSTWRYARAGTPWVKKPPTQYVRERIRFGTQPMDDPDPADMNDMVRMLGSECLMFSTDYPHWDYDTPSRVFQTLPSEDKPAVFRSNAEAVFRW